MANTFVAGDTGTTLQLTCKDQHGSAINLTGCKVTLFWTCGDGEMRSGLTTLTDAANGVCSYQFVKDDLRGGTMTAEAEIEDATGNTRTSLEAMTFTVRSRIGPITT